MSGAKVVVRSIQAAKVVLNTMPLSALAVRTALEERGPNRA